MRWGKENAAMANVHCGNNQVAVRKICFCPDVFFMKAYRFLGNASLKGKVDQFADKKSISAWAVDDADGAVFFCYQYYYCMLIQRFML